MAHEGVEVEDRGVIGSVRHIFSPYLWAVMVFSNHLKMMWYYECVTEGIQ